MKKINNILIICMLSLNASAAFTEPEMSQLEEINNKAIKKTEDSRRILDSTIKKQYQICQNKKNR
ncbi:hypothetical protein PMPD1_2210 [Paramixta manurensis]|uniref:Uncharacterized protein n=1 Tax=Paramixta manurensis TaxID=2740817 RepID=A0A6M8U8Y9_9GAMM|nr:hypothetical protein PMPD1_2210 [Erwiniaceae bacterium PD-1]